MRRFLWSGLWALLVLGLLWPAPASAADASGPQSGVGIYLGGGTSNMHAPGVDQNTLGFAFGFDYQLALGQHLSINPFYQRGSYAAGQIDVSGSPAIVKWTVRTVGVQGRLWFDNFYLGAHVARYTLKFSQDPLLGISTTTVESTNGSGAALGFESPGGVFLALQYDVIHTATLRLTAPVVYLGVRF